jgi:hypothetical protein
MTIDRTQLVDLSLARWCHCITRCVRRAFLLGQGDHNRKERINNRLEELADIFAVAVGGFSVMDNHRSELGVRQDCRVTENERLHLDKAARRPCRSQSSDRPIVGHPSRQRCWIASGGRFRSIARLCPIEDLRGLDSTRDGMMQGFSLRSFVKLVDYTGRLFRQGKALISAELDGIFERLGCNAQSWQSRIEKLRDGRLLRRFFATTRAKLREIAERLGVRHVVNLAGCPAR